jgi:hypothetical protein
MKVRDELKSEDIALYNALERSWQIAHERWLPAIPPSLGSHNAYPHLHNMELRLDQVIEAFSPTKSGFAFKLSAAEKYLLLSAILFHDIGRAVSNKNHAKHSFDFICGNWAELGIESANLAKTIARLAEAHDIKTFKENKRGLGETTIDPHGRIREKGLAAVLILLDELDTSQSRVVPKSIMTGLKGFRILVEGIQIDAESQLIRSVLSTTDDMQDYISAQKTAAISGNETKSGVRVLTDIMWKKCFYSDADQSEQEKLEEYKKSVKGDEPILADPGELYGIIGNFIFGRIQDREPGSLSRSIENLKEALAKYESWLPLPHIQLAIVQNDLGTHIQALKAIRNDLRAMGITLDEWLIEAGEHLFDSEGKEKWEPIFDKSYLVRVAKEMWRLSAHVFGSSFFGYDTLAAAVRDPDIGRVRRAVQRLRILTDHLPQRSCPDPTERKPSGEGAIDENALNWRWKVSGKRTGNSPGEQAPGGCGCVHLEEVLSLLEQLDKLQKKGEQRRE